MRDRDKAILEDLKRFRVLDRNHIIAMHFSEQKHPVNTCNRIMNRLALTGHVKVDTSRKPYHYMHVENKMSFDSTKIPHFKSIADFYCELIRLNIKPKKFEVEPKVTVKGGIEPDIFMNWAGANFFVEIQRSKYTAKVMQDKINRYEKFYNEGAFKPLSEKMPLIWILSDYTYTKFETRLNIYQTKDVEEFVNKHCKKNT